MKIDSEKKKIIAQKFTDFCETIASLRDPVSGCPWDLEQTHESLRRYMVEEAYEASLAMSEGSKQEIAEELGDVLLQVVLNAQVAQDAKDFSILDVIESINSKMRRRHPHVFDPSANAEIDSSEKVSANWERIKKYEKKNKEAAKSYFSDTTKVFPATNQALAIGKLAAKIQFDWLKVEDVFTNLQSEVAELKEELNKSKFCKSAALYSEIGDVYFSLAQLCRHLGYDPEITAVDGNRKFLERFRKVEVLAGKAIELTTRDELEDLWKRAKK